MSRPFARPFVDPRTILARHALRPKKSFGQNFLVAGPTVERVADLCVPRLPARVIEIGAGVGTLTSALLARGADVVAIERDRDLLPVLRAELADDLARGALTLLEADAATVDLSALLDRSSPSSRSSGSSVSSHSSDDVLAGNLPYQITGRLLERATALRERVDRVVVMVQREVADRILAPAGSDAYGQLSVFVQAAFEVRRAMNVGAGSFHPRPDVESAVVVLTPDVHPRAEETDIFRKVVHAAFGARRKTLRNALAALMTSENAPRVAALGIDLGRRGETLTVEEFTALACAIAPSAVPARDRVDAEDDG